MATFFESEVEEAAFEWLNNAGWNTVDGWFVAPDGLYAVREDYSSVHLEEKLWEALHNINRHLSSYEIEDVYRKLTRPEGPTLETQNREFHRMMLDGVKVEYRTSDGTVRGAIARIIDFDDPSNNDWLAVSQFAVVENTNERRLDIVLFVNGLPLGIIELKNPADKDATIWTAWQQLQTYKAELTNLFSMNAV